jgi:hypothetical protein
MKKIEIQQTDERGQTKWFAYSGHPETGLSDDALDAELQKIMLQRGITYRQALNQYTLDVQRIQGGCENALAERVYAQEQVPPDVERENEIYELAASVCKDQEWPVVWKTYSALLKADAVKGWGAEKLASYCKRDAEKICAYEFTVR